MPTTASRPATLPDGRPVMPAADYGFFGPQSVSWRVWQYPTSVLLGFMRAVVIEELDPFLLASVDQSGQVTQRTPLRYDRTMQYFATVLFGDAESVLRSADVLMKIHSRATGTDPITGRTFDANDPDSQLWIHLTAWHSILYCFETFGPGRLSAADEARYWRECALAAEFQTIDPAAVPTSREGIARYFETYRPHLVGSEAAQQMMDYLLDLPAHILPASTPRPLRAVLTAVLRRGVLATMPLWMRRLGGTPQRRLTDRLVTPLLRLVMRVLATDPRRAARALQTLSPRSLPVLAPVLFRVPAADPAVYTPAGARERFGLPETPRQQYLRTLADRARAAASGSDGGQPQPYGHHHHDPVLEFSA